MCLQAITPIKMCSVSRACAQFRIYYVQLQAIRHSTEHEPAAAVHDVHNANDQQESPATQGEWLQREFQARSAWAEPAFRCSQALLQSGPF